MKKLLLILAFLFVGCNSIDGVPPTSPIATEPEEPTYTYATIKYKNNALMGTTRAEAPDNGNYQIYDFGTGIIVGAMQADTSVTDISGRELGLCEGATVTDTGVQGDCILPSYEVAICPDTRNGDFNPSYSPSVCNGNGYFWCSLAQQCLNKPVNVPSCGEIGNR